MDLKPLFPGILALGLAFAGPASGNAGAGTPPERPRSMYDVVNDPVQDAALSVRAALDAHRRAATWLGRAEAVLLRADRPNPITLTAHDGSTAVLTFDAGKKKWMRYPDTTRDASGNLIPATLSDVTGGAGSFRVYHFSTPNDYRNFVNQAKRLGASFSHVGSGRTRATCTSIPPRGSVGMSGPYAACELK